MHDATIQTARGAGGDPFFLAFALAEYARRESLDEPALMALLGATPDALAGARLCRMPRGDPDGFRDDVARVAARFGLQGDPLAKAVRHGQAVATMRPAADAEPGAPAPFLAARDKTE